MYNATAYKKDAAGNVVSTQAVELNADGLVVRAAGYWTHSIGTAAYDADWRGTFFSFVTDVEIVRDGAAGYRNALHGLALPVTYQ